MASAEIGALRVRLGLDAGEFKKGSKEAESALDRLSNRFNLNATSMARAGAAMGAAVVAATAVIGHSVLNMLREMDKLGKMAQSMGIPVESLSRLKLAADLSDVSVEKLATSVGRLSRNMMEAASGGTSEAARSFQALGISVTTSSGQLKSAEQIILEVAAKFQGMEDGAGKTALAMALFGRAGAEMIPMLNQGATGIRGMMNEADQFGIVVSSQAAKAAEEFNDTLTRLRAAKDGLVQQVTVRVLPALQMVANRFLEVAKDGDTMKAIAERIVQVFVVVAQSVATVIHVFQRLGAEVIAIKDALAALWAGDGIARARQIMTDAATATDQARDALRQFNTELQNMTSGWQAVVTPASEFPARVAAPIVQSTRAMTDALRTLRDERRAAFDELVNSETETFANKMRAAEQAVRDKTITMTQYGAVVRRVNKENERHMDSMATATASALTTIFKDNKAAAIGAAIINTAAGITRNLREYPQPYAGIMAGITAATGAAQIAAIRSTNQSGGGSAPSASSSAPAPVQQEFTQTLHVQGINPSQMFRGDVVKDLAQQLVQYQLDGGRVVIQ